MKKKGCCRSSRIRNWFTNHLPLKKEKYLQNSFLGHGKSKMTDQEREMDRLEKALKDEQLKLKY
jgi:hypothetical protein